MVKESAAFTARSSKEDRQLMLKRPELQMVFSKRFLKTMKERVEQCIISLWIFF